MRAPHTVEANLLPLKSSDSIGSHGNSHTLTAASRLMFDKNKQKLEIVA